MQSTAPLTRRLRVQRAAEPRVAARLRAAAERVIVMRTRFMSMLEGPSAAEHGASCI